MVFKLVKSEDVCNKTSQFPAVFPDYGSIFDSFILLEERKAAWSSSVLQPVVS